MTGTAGISTDYMPRPWQDVVRRAYSKDAQFIECCFCYKASSRRIYVERLQGLTATEGDEVQDNLGIEVLAGKGE